MVFARFSLVLALPLVVGACRRESPIEVYEVPKESVPVAQADPHGGMEMPPGGGDPHDVVPSGGEVIEPGVGGEVPGHWEKAGGPSMRVASYRVGGGEGAMADISLVVLTGAAGGVLDNINRWRGQIGLEAVSGEELAASSGKLSTPVGEAVVADLVGEKERIVAAVIPLGDSTWFYKMRGESELVGREKEGFLRWIETAEVKVELPGEAPPAESPHGSGPPRNVQWTVPAGWRETPGDSLRAGIFITEGGAEVSVSRLGGDGGGDLPNVNRWRRQIGLGPLATLDGAVEEVKAGELSMSLVGMEGDEAATVAAWVLRDGESWFFKLTGPKEAVRDEREAFITFLKSIRFDHP